MTSLLILLALLLIVLGLLGTVLPIIPGSPLIFVGAFLIAYMDNFTNIGKWTLISLAVLCLISIVLDFIATGWGAKSSGASKLAVSLAIVGTLLGVAFGLLGLLFGPLIGAIIGEVISKRDLIQAGKVGLGTWFGLLVSGALKIALSFSMIGILAASYLL